MENENFSFARHFLDDALSNFRKYKELGDKSFAQLSDADFHYKPDEESNSIAIIIRHMYGNMRSRWTDFLTSDGEKPDRNRDSEFEENSSEDKNFLLQQWEAGWKILFDALENITPEDFSKKVLIRHEPHSIVEAVNRQLTHYAYHIGQIVYLAKHIRSSQWQSLSIPKNRSKDFNKAMEEKFLR